MASPVPLHSTKPTNQSLQSMGLQTLNEEVKTTDSSNVHGATDLGNYLKELSRSSVNADFNDFPNVADPDHIQLFKAPK